MDSTSNTEVPLSRFAGPRFWPLWIAVGALRLVCRLPYRLQLPIGRGIGRLLYLAIPARRRIAAANLALCFPEQDHARRQELLRAHFASLGIALLELGMAWWAPDDRLRRLVRLEGLEHLERAVAAGQGVILLSGHFAATELTGRILRLHIPDIAALYRRSSNPLVDELLRRGRRRAVSRLIPKDNMRQMIRTLREGVPVWYAPDQAHRWQFSALLPFCGEPAMTNTALTQIVRLGRAVVIPYLPRRRADGSGYDVQILPPLDDFPGASPEDDARRVNELLEAHIRTAPEQYYWIHRRFKGRPAGFEDPYAQC